MANWKKVIVSGSQAQLNQLSVDTSVNITGSLNTSGSVNFRGLTNASQATIVGIDAATGQLYYQGTGSFTANSASYALSASYASNASTADSATSASRATSAANADNATSASRATSAANADNATTANSATSASYALSSSYSNFALTASYVIDKTIVTGSNFVFSQPTPASTWVLNHYLNSQYPVFQVFNASNEVIIPTLTEMKSCYDTNKWTEDYRYSKKLTEIDNNLIF